MSTVWRKQGKADFIFCKDASANASKKLQRFLITCYKRFLCSPVYSISSTDKHRRPFLIKFSRLLVEDSRWASTGTKPAGDRKRRESEDEIEEAITLIVQRVTLHLNVTGNFSLEGSNRSANNKNTFLRKGLPVYYFNNQLSECSVRKFQLLEKN